MTSGRVDESKCKGCEFVLGVGVGLISQCSFVPIKADECEASGYTKFYRPKPAPPVPEWEKWEVGSVRKFTIFAFSDCNSENVKKFYRRMIDRSGITATPFFEYESAYCVEDLFKSSLMEAAEKAGIIRRKVPKLEVGGWAEGRYSGDIYHIISMGEGETINIYDIKGKKLDGVYRGYLLPIPAPAWPKEEDPKC